MLDSQLPEDIRDLIGDLAPRARPATQLQRGERVGRYRIEELLGRGGFGLVYRARDPDAERDVALKLLWRPVQTEDEARFREAVVVAKLSHSAIVTLYDTGTHHGHRYLVFEHLRGETLEARIDRSPLSFDDAMRVALLVADALRCAHAADVVHGDLKPANVFLCADGSAKLLDFGLAHSLAERDLAPLPGGTPGFVAPEQGLGRGDKRSDVFSAAMLLYASLTGELPFALTARHALVARPPDEAAIQRLAVPRRLKQHLAAATALDPDQRPASGAAWHAHLRKVWVPAWRSWSGITSLALALSVLAATAIFHAELGLAIDEAFDRAVVTPQETETEPNDDRTQATPVSVGRRVKGYISDRRDVDVFQFATGNSYRNLLEIRAVSAKWGFAAGLSITDADGNDLGTVGRTDYRAANRTFTLSARPETTYFVTVWCEQHCGYGDYELSVRPKS